MAEFKAKNCANSTDSILSSQFEQNHSLTFELKGKKKIRNLPKENLAVLKVNDLQCFLNTRKVARVNWSQQNFSAGTITCGCKQNFHR